ncbi:Adenylyl cyclase-associated protein 2 [Galemys pyrenaicus]|uniref:Adenylyl cyclase-associated protein 2 n=1 Tax=Galemys pyrenaicus TaxID=202257 RepID=A0A8J6DKG4_GALPY|nr:Adenylyl cyclase-associated protein 2 [Galemys pyrenaicus]
MSVETFYVPATDQMLVFILYKASDPGTRNLGLDSTMAEMQGLMERLEQAVCRLELLSGGPHQPAGNCGEINGVIGGVAPSVEAFDKLMNSMVAEFLKKSKILAGDVETHVSIFLPSPP